LAPFVPVWSGWAPGRHLALTVMPVVFVLLVATYVPGHIRARTRHPMLIATILWVTVHLIAIE
jgi:uncharacterized membrane protein